MELDQLFEGKELWLPFSFQAMNSLVSWVFLGDDVCVTEMSPDMSNTVLGT